MASSNNTYGTTPYWQDPTTGTTTSVSSRGVKRTNTVTGQPVRPQQPGPPQPQQQQKPTWPTPSGNTGTPQGWGEDWYIKNGWQWDRPTQTSEYWNGQKGWFNSPQQGESDLYRLSDELEGPNAADQAWDRLQGEYYTPGESEGFYANQGQSLMGNSQIGDYWGKTQGQFQGPGAMESAFGNLYSKANQDGALMQNAGAVTGDINSARNTENFMGRNARSFEGPGYTEGYAQGYNPEQGYSEGLMQSGAGLDSLYDRLYQKGSERLGNEAAARGGYNSGASLRAAEELNLDLGADEIRQRISLADQADKYRMDERKFGLSVGQGADSSMMNRLGLGITGSGQADTTALGRADATRGLYKDIEDQRQSGIRLAGDLANDTQSAMMARLLGGASVAGMASDDQVNRYNTTSSAANNAQNAGNNRRNGAMTAANNVANTKISQTQTRGNLSGQAQQLALQRIQGGMAGAGDADQIEFQRLAGGQGAANLAQNMRTGRLRGDFQDTLDLGSREANTYLQGMDPARREQFQARISEIDGMIQRGEIDAAAGEAQLKELFAMVGLGVNAYDAYKNKPPTAPSSGPGSQRNPLDPFKPDGK
jgi:hypothetical protein